MNNFITFLASFLIWVMFLGLTFLFMIDGKRKKEIALHAGLSSLVSWIISEMIKTFFPTSRPFWVNGKSPLTLTLPMDGAFPSVHAAVAFALAFSVYKHNRKMGYFFMSAAALVSLGRILSNVHSVLDVVGGGILGVSVALIVNKMHLTT